MIANSLTILVGLWLSYRAIFAVPAGELTKTEMMVTGIVVILLALWARRTDLMAWHSGTGLALGSIILALTAVRHTVGMDPLVLFWMILLIGIAVAISAMWSLLYRPGTDQPAPSSR